MPTASKTSLDKQPRDHWLDDIKATRFRLNPHFQMVSYDDLEEADQKKFALLCGEPDFYGLLFPPASSALPIRSLSRDAALLFQKLREPSYVPHLLKSIFGAGAKEHLRRLIADGIVEVECHGEFPSGLSFSGLKPGDDTECSRFLVVRLSQEALEYGAELVGLSLPEIAGRLYMYNRLPSTPELQRKLDDPQKVIAFLSKSPATFRQLATHWVCSEMQKSWLVWRSPQNRPLPGFKLYISPMIEALPEVFRETVGVLARMKCGSFKLGLSAFGLLRPDKFVAYFESQDALLQAAQQILELTRGAAPHGVPFSAAMDHEGLLSWGMDPPSLTRDNLSPSPQSWRQWVAERAAVHLASARDGSAEAKAQLVLQRLGIEGIDTASWNPSLAIWRGLSGYSETVA